MTMPEGNGRLLQWRVDRLTERVEEIEEVNPKLLAYEVAQMNKRLSLLLKVAITIGASMVTGSILLVFNLIQNAP